MRRSDVRVTLCTARALSLSSLSLSRARGARVLASSCAFSSHTDAHTHTHNDLRYRYWSGPVLYPFGHGISYTTFSLTWTPTPPAATTFTAARDAMTYSVVVKNTGTVYTADEVILAYFKPKAETIASLSAEDSSGPPVVKKQLFAFERITLAPGASRTLRFTVNATALALVDGDGHSSLHAGEYDVVFSRGCVGCAELVAPVEIKADAPIRIKTFRKWW